MSATIAPPPTVVTSTGLYMGQNFLDWLVIQLMGRLQTCPQMLSSPTTLTGQTASIGTTAFLMGTVNAGVYRVGWTARCSTPASSSSSLTVTVSYTRKGVSCSQTSAAMTSNATNAPASGFFELNSDGGAPISWSTTYGSVGGTSMIYELDLTCENVT